MAAETWTKKTLNMLRRLLPEEEEGNPPPPVPSKPGQWYDGSEIKSLSMEQILEEWVHEGNDKVYTIALQDFSGAVGDKWDRLKTKVDMIADNVARRHIGRGTIYKNFGEGLYVLVVPGNDSDGHMQRVFAMAEDLGRRLVGDKFRNLKKSGIIVAQADASDLLGPDGRFDPAAVTRIALDADLALPLPDEPLQTPPADAPGRMVAMDLQAVERAQGHMVVTAIAVGEDADVPLSGTREEKEAPVPDWTTAPDSDTTPQVADSATRAEKDFCAWDSGETFVASGDIAPGGGASLSGFVMVTDGAPGRDPLLAIGAENASGGGARMVVTGAADPAVETDPRWIAAGDAAAGRDVGESGEIRRDPLLRPQAASRGGDVPEVWIDAAGPGKAARPMGYDEAAGRRAEAKGVAIVGGPPKAAGMTAVAAATPSGESVWQAMAPPDGRGIAAATGAATPPPPPERLPGDAPSGQDRAGVEWRAGEVVVRPPGQQASPGVPGAARDSGKERGTWEPGTGPSRATLAPIAPPGGAGRPDIQEWEKAAAALPPAAAAPSPPAAAAATAAREPAPPPPLPERTPPAKPAQMWQAGEPREEAPEAKMVDIDHAPTVPGEEWRAIAKMAPKPREAERPAALLPRSSFAMVEAMWRPTWTMARRRVELHLCRPILRDGRSVRGGDDLLPLLGGVVERLDYETILAAVVSLSRVGGRALGTIVLPIHFPTLRLQAEIDRILPALDACAGLPGIGGLWVEVTGVPATAKSARLAEMVARVRDHCAGVLLRRDLAAPQWDPASVGAVEGVGIDLAGLNQWERNPGHLAETLRQFRAQARPLPAYAWGLRDHRELTVAIEAGFAITNGADLLPDTALPACGAFV